MLLKIKLILKQRLHTGQLNQELKVLLVCSKINYMKHYNLIKRTLNNFRIFLFIKWCYRAVKICLLILKIILGFRKIPASKILVIGLIVFK